MKNKFLVITLSLIVNAAMAMEEHQVVEENIIMAANDGGITIREHNGYTIVEDNGVITLIDPHGNRFTGHMGQGHEANILRHGGEDLFVTFGDGSLEIRSEDGRLLAEGKNYTEARNNLPDDFTLN